MDWLNLTINAKWNETASASETKKTKTTSYYPGKKSRLIFDISKHIGVAIRTHCLSRVVAKSKWETYINNIWLWRLIISVFWDMLQWRRRHWLSAFHFWLVRTRARRISINWIRRRHIIFFFVCLTKQWQLETYLYFWISLHIFWY